MWAEYCSQKMVSQLNGSPCKDQAGMIIIGTILSWITIFFALYRIHKELKEEEFKFK